MRAQSRFGPPVNNGLQLPGDVTTTDPRCPPIELATDVIARQLALHEGLIKAEGTGVTEAYTENDVQREGTGVIYPRSRSSSSQVKSPVVTIEPSSSMEEHVMKTEAVPSPELLQVPQGNRDLRQPSDAFDDTDMKISPIREPVKLQPNTSPASPASPLVIPNVEPTIVTPQIPITVSNSESVRDRPSSLPRQISPPYIKQVRRLSVVGLGSDQVSLSPTISVASLPSSSTPQQRRFPSDERPLLPDVAQSIDVLVGSFSKAVRYRWDYDQISIQIFNNERKLQTLPPSLPIVPSTKSVDPRLAINQKKQSPQPEVEPPLSERELTENKIARLLKDQAVAQTKLRDEMGKIQRHVQSCYNATRNDFVEGVARSQTETKDIVEGVLLAIAGPKNESMGLGLHIAGGDVASAVVRNEGDALGPISPAPPVSTTVGDANSARLDHLEVEFNEQFALLSEQCRVAFDTLKEDRNEVVNTFENRFDSLNKLFVSGAEFKQFRDSLGQLKKLLEAVVIVDQSRSEEAKVLSNVVKDVNTRISAMERQLKAQQQQSQSLINEGNATTAVKGETATKSTASSVIQPDPQVASHVQELQKEIANLVTDNARLRSEIEQCVEASRSEAQKHENEVEALKREVGGLKSENAQNREQFIATVEGYQAEMTRIGNSMSVLAAIATGNPGFDYLRAHLGNIVVGNNVVAGAGSNDPTGHNSVQPTSFPLALPVPPSGDRGGVESRNAVQKPCLSDGLSGVDVGRISGDDSAVIFKVED
ncbi:hypothetical protein FRB93_011066 [Tulasnella sp. JGI-2019a]|nr:hypothetical protein FRB93_011066 [Tulasnella sp. JGI-2019a]